VLLAGNIFAIFSEFEESGICRKQKVLPEKQKKTFWLK
jgi:hypothetical protein